MTETITIPGYRIGSRLGQGGMASVYLAIQQSFEREVALKVMSPLLNSDPSFAARFKREARIVAQLNHASIVPVFDVGEYQSYHYLSMEYLPAGDLKRRVLEGERDLSLALKVCMALSAALEVAHRKGFVHRDIKPENILFREDGTPVLTDFGIARAVESGRSMTLAGMLVGTPDYMSPEQVKGLELDGRSDLYSVGIVFYEILTGSVPFKADSTLSVALKQVGEALPPLPPEYADFQEFLDCLTAKNREERFASGAEVVRALRLISSGRGGRDRTLARALTPTQGLSGGTTTGTQLSRDPTPAPQASYVSQPTLARPRVPVGIRGLGALTNPPQEGTPPNPTSAGVDSPVSGEHATVTERGSALTPSQPGAPQLESAASPVAERDFPVDPRQPATADPGTVSSPQLAVGQAGNTASSGQYRALAEPDVRVSPPRQAVGEARTPTSPPLQAAGEVGTPTSPPRQASGETYVPTNPQRTVVIEPVRPPSSPEVAPSESSASTQQVAQSPMGADGPPASSRSNIARNRPLWFAAAGVAAICVALAFIIAKPDKGTRTSQADAASSSTSQVAVTPPQPNTQAATAVQSAQATPGTQPQGTTLQTPTTDQTVAQTSPPAPTAESGKTEDTEPPPSPATAAAEAAEARAEAKEARHKHVVEQRRWRKAEAALLAQQRAAEARAAQQAAQEAQIQSLLAAAKTQYAAGALWQPAGSSAADSYRAILKMQPQRADALAGAQRVANVLADEAAAAEAAGNVDSSKQLIDQIQSLQPSQPKLADLQTRLEQLQTTPAALDAKARGRLDRAAKYIARAEEDLSKTPLDFKSVDDATDYYDRALSAEPKAPGLPSLKERLIAAYPTAVQMALDNHDTKRAQKLIDTAHKHNWSSPELDQLETTLQAGSQAVSNPTAAIKEAGAR